MMQNHIMFFSNSQKMQCCHIQYNISWLIDFADVYDLCLPAYCGTKLRKFAFLANENTISTEMLL